MLALSWTSASLAVFASAARAGFPPQAEQPSTVAAKQSSTQVNEEQVESPKQASYQDQGAVLTSQHNFRELGSDFILDQEQIWASPARLQISDVQWLVPVGGVTAALMFTDRGFSAHLSHRPATIHRYQNLSKAGVGALLGGAGGMWLLSYATHDSHWRETGFLAGEAALNSLVAVETLKYPVGRQRPYQGNGSGAFFQGGTSFPSEHAAAAWAVAGVIAHEYPGILTKLAVYGLAAAVDYSRVRGQQHFPSDVFVGSMIGNLVGQNIYARHHDPEGGGEEWLSTSQFMRRHWNPAPENMGSPNVPLDSWIYPAMERLVSAGMVESAFLNVRPWTRLECVALLNEASSQLNETDRSENEMAGIVVALRAEFASELHAQESGEEKSFRLESVYARVTGIEGSPLTDSYHFGQTIYNDDGRPYQEGLNSIVGFSSYATLNRFAWYFDGEFQHAPSAPAYSLAIRQVIASVDLNPLQPAAPVAAVNQFTIESAYLNTNVDNWNLSFGKQEMWWSPSYGSSFLFSDNAEPIYMFRVNRIAPFILPWILRYLGPVKVDLFLGKLRGNDFPPRPLFHGEKITFKPTKNLELGFSRTVEFGGAGRAMTLGAIWNSYTSFNSSVGVAANENPGHRVGGFDFSYRLPFLRDWLTVYADSMSDDDPSPIDAPRRASVNPGLHLTKFPGLPKLDFRVEAVYTDSSTHRSEAGQFAYAEAFYHDAYTNNEFLMGSWIGREGVGYQAWSRYSLNPRSAVQLGYRHVKVDGDFIPGGETVNDGSIKLDWWMKHDLSASVLLQYEKWLAPILENAPQTNWTSSVEITFWPRVWSK